MNRIPPPSKVFRFLRGLTCAAVGSTVLTLAIPNVHAQNGTNATTVYNGYVSAYLQTTNVNGNTHHLPYLAISTTNRDRATLWQQAYLITGLEDNYDRLHASADQTLITNLLNSFLAEDGTDWTDIDHWNDDVEWACIALAHGYQQTGNSAYLSAAESNWNAVYSRGWTSTLGGGILEKQTATSKCVLSNAPFIIAGCMLYRSTGDSSYLTKCQQVYSWMRANCFNTSTGQVIEGVDTSGPLTSNNSYNHGIFLQAANALYKITTTQQYFNDAQLVVNWIVNNHSVMTEDHPSNGPFGSEEFFRGLSLFAIQNNLWSTYQPWLQANCQAAWNNRRTDYSITHNDFESATPTTELLAMESISSLIVQAVTQISAKQGPHSIINYANGRAADNGSSTGQGAGVTQWPWSGGKQQLWDFSQNSDGTWTIKSEYSGQVLDDPASSTGNVQVEQWPGNGGSNQKWVVTQQSNGAYLIQNQASGKVLDNDASSTDPHPPVIQYTPNGGSNQTWYLK